jgi:hypothetical protein
MERVLSVANTCAAGPTKYFFRFSVLLDDDVDAAVVVAGNLVSLSLPIL